MEKRVLRWVDKQSVAGKETRSFSKVHRVIGVYRGGGFKTISYNSA